MEIKTDLVYKFDQFFTKEDVAKKCYKVFCKTINVKDFDCLIEPSAGEGSFFKILPEKNRVAIEIDENLCKLNKDYLNLN
jgi:16S rRNA A1518/A1519 N6-dimethyltransferase RsmA/KsgA/DIM1 with predicted DNA glycosylase/AP lyase activity